MPSTPNLDDLKIEIMTEFHDFKTVYKTDSLLMKMIKPFMVSTFMDHFVTTIWNTVYLPVGWDSWSETNKCAVLRHERIHMRQAKKLTFPLFTFLYLCVFFPVGLAYFRAKFEMEAYAESMAAWKDYGMDYKSTHTKEWVTSEFTGPDYGYMWPFKASVDSWFDKTVTKLDA